MAGIDKIYGTQSQYRELKKWLLSNQIPIRCRTGFTCYASGYTRTHYAECLPIEYLYPARGYKKEDRPISNFPEAIDKWLLKNCPIEWVQDRLRQQYGLNSKESAG